MSCHVMSCHVDLHVNYTNLRLIWIMNNQILSDYVLYMLSRLSFIQRKELFNTIVRHGNLAWQVNIGSAATHCRLGSSGEITCLPSLCWPYRWGRSPQTGRPAWTCRRVARVSFPGRGIAHIWGLAVLVGSRVKITDLPGVTLAQCSGHTSKYHSSVYDPVVILFMLCS